MRVLPGSSGACLALGFIALVFVCPAWAKDPAAEFEAVKSASLEGIESLDVMVITPRADSGCHHVAPEQIETAVEARLQRAGIPLDPEPDAYLFVSLGSMEPLRDLLCGFVVSLELHQVVFLVRDTRIATVGITWRRTGFGVTTTAQTPDTLQGVLANLVDHFIAEYREQNPNQ